MQALRLCAGATVIAAALAGAVQAAERSKAVRAEFQRQNPCPANGAMRGPCPGYVADHVVPLCAGGADSAANMQWQTVESAKVKDREEAKHCRALRP